MNITDELRATLESAFDEARARRHEYVTLEHLLLALCGNLEGLKILKATGVDVDQLLEEIESYLDDHLERIPEGRELEPRQTVAFWRVLQRAAAHVQSAGKEEIEGRDVLVAVFREPESQAAYLLAQQGITRLDVLNYVSHGIPKTPRVPAAGDGTEAEADDDDADEEAIGEERGEQHDQRRQRARARVAAAADEQPRSRNQEHRQQQEVVPGRERWGPRRRRADQHRRRQESGRDFDARGDEEHPHVRCESAPVLGRAFRIEELEAWTQLEHDGQ